MSAKGSKSKDKKSDSAKSGGKEGDKKKTTAGQILQSLGKSFAGKDPKSDKGGKIKILPGKDAKGDKGGGKDGGKGAVGGKGGAVGGNAPGGGSGKPQAGGTNQAQANNTVARMESLPSTGLATGKTMIPMVIMPRAGGSGRSGEGKGAGSGKTWAGRQLQKVGGYLKADFKQTFGFSGADSEKSKARQSDRQERRNSYSNRGRDANNSHRTNSATGKKLNADGQTRKEMKTNQKIEREKKLSGGFSKTENKMALKAQASAWSIKGGMHADGKTINTDGKLNAGDITALKDLKMNMKIEAATTVKASISGGAPQAEGSKEAGGQGTGASPKSGAVGMVNPSQSQGLAAMNAGGAPIAQVASLFKGGDKHQGVAADRKIANATFRKSNVVRNEKGKKTVASTSGKQVTKKEFKREQKANRQEARNPGGVSKMANKMSRIEAAAAMKKEHGGKLTEDDLKTLRNMKMDQKISDEKATTTGGFSKTENKQDLQMAKAYLKGKNPDGKLTANDKETIRSDKQDQKIKNEKAGSQARGTSVDGKGFSRTEGRAKVNARMAEMKGTDKDGKPIERDLTPAEVKELRGMEREQRKNRQPSSQSTEMTGRAASARGSGQYEDAVGYEIAGFSLNGKNFGQSLLAILKLLADIVLTKYGLNTSDVGKIFEKGSWGSGLKPIVNKIVDLIKLLLAVYSMLCEISNYTKAVQAMSGKSAPKGFMDDFNNNELFNIGKYHANTNALLSWLDPRMQGAGTGPGLVYPFSLIINPVMDGLKLGLGSVAQGIDNAVTSKKFDAPVAMATDGFFGVTAGSQGKTYYKKEQEEKWVEYDPKTRTYFKDDDEETAQLKGAGMPVKESPIGSVSGSDRLPVPKGAVTNVIKGKKSPKKYKFRVQTGIWKQCDASTLTASEKESLDKSVSEQPITFISAKAGNGIELDILQKKGYASRLAEKVDMKAEAGVYLLKYFGGVFGYDRRKGVEANIGALRNQSAVLRNKDSSAADLAMAQDYVNMTRSLMGKINSNEMMRDAIDMKHDRKTEEKINGLKIGGALAGKTNKEIKEYVNAQVKSKALDGKTGDEIKDYFQAAQERKDAEAELKTLKGDSSDPKKIIVGEIDKQAMGTHAYNATKGKITELEATMNLSDLLGAVEMPFSRKDIRHANKVTQELFAIQLDATVMFCNAYFSANDQGSKDAVSAVFAPLLDGFNNFTKAAPGQKDVRLGELDIRLSGLKAQAEAAEQGLPAILKAPAKNDKTAMVNGLQDLIAAAGERVRAEETKKEKEKASENITFEPPQIQADVSLSGSMADYAKNEFKQEKEDQRVTDIEDAYISAKKDAQAAPIKEAAASVAFYSAVAAANNDTKLAEEGDALAEKQDKSAFIQDSEDYAEKVKELYVPKQPKESASKPSQSPQNQEFMDLYKKR